MKSGEIPYAERIQHMIGLPLCHKIAITDRAMLCPHGSVRGEENAFGRWLLVTRCWLACDEPFGSAFDMSSGRM